MKLGITGHQKLDNSVWVRQEILRVIELQGSPVIGVTSLAVGTDQLFAQAVLDSAGSLYIIVPCEEYTKAFDPTGRAEYERLLSKAAAREVMSSVACDEKAYFSAGKKVIDISDLVIAVWNGKPAAGLGGTGDVVEYIRLQEKPYIHLNPVTQETTHFLKS